MIDMWIKKLIGLSTPINNLKTIEIVLNKTSILKMKKYKNSNFLYIELLRPSIEPDYRIVPIDSILSVTKYQLKDDDGLLYSFDIKISFVDKANFKRSIGIPVSTEIITDKIMNSIFNILSW